MSQCANLCALHKFSLTLAEINPENGESGKPKVASVSFKSPSRSNLPSFLLPCPCCGRRMTITAITPARSNGGAESANLADLEDITHGCAQCGTTLTRTVRPLAESDQETAIRA
jgi:hypothetical protein